VSFGCILLIGTLDSKGHEAGFVRDRLREHGLETLVIDAGSSGPPTIDPDIARSEVFRLAGTSSEEVEARRDRGESVTHAARGVARLVEKLQVERTILGAFGLGGSAGTLIATSGMRQLPFGVPKVMVSTVASGQTRSYVGASDITMCHSVADLAGLNRFTRSVLNHAVLALVGMVTLDRQHSPIEGTGPVIAATMFGVTTPCVDQARKRLEAAGAEVLVFHATGTGGAAMEGLIRDGQITGVLDLTTTELADELVGGILSAGPDRLEAAGRRGIPQVVSLGALDMVNFGPRETVPERFQGRTFYQHNPAVTLMRTNPEENQALGERIAEVLSRARGPSVLMVPRGGLSALDAPDRPFHDPEANEALFDAIRSGISPGSHVQILWCDEHINHDHFSKRASEALMELLSLPKGDACLRTS